MTDKKGNIPRDLTAQDFKIVEDGKDQKITSFSFTGNPTPGRSGKHFIALVFDYEEPTFREEAIRFVDQFSSPDLYISIYARMDEGRSTSVQAFTTDSVRLRTALRDMQIVGESRSMRWVGNAQIPEVPMLDRIDKVTADLKPMQGRKSAGAFRERAHLFQASASRGVGPGGPSVPADDRSL